MSELTDASVADRHRILAEQFLRLVDGVQDWDAPTPVKEWRAIDVVDHLSWLPGMLAGLGVDLALPRIDSPVEQLTSQTVRVQEVLDGPEATMEVETPMSGTTSLADVIDRFYVLDLFVHAWDLAQGTGQRLHLDEDYSAGAYQGMSAMGPALHASGQFGSPQPVADDAPVQDRLIALLGRDPAWAPPR